MGISPSVSVANIGPRERRKRLGAGIVAVVVGVASSGFLVYFGARPVWSLLLFFPFFIGALGYFQSRDKT